MRRQVADGGMRLRLARALVLLVVAGGLAFAAARFAPPPTRLRPADAVPAAPSAAADADAKTDDASAAGDDAGPTDDAGAPADGDAGDIAPVRELTAEEIEAELKAAEAAMGGAAPADVRNRAAERPLPADLPVALPSDI
jgi:hypothetical protein